MACPKFSIITCTRNSAKTLPDTIRSVSLQNYRDFEHIFVDGNSTDQTLPIIRDMSPGAVIVEGVTGGISRAMNAGIEKAKGEIIVHLHSDDFFADSNTLELVSSSFDQSEVSWAVGNFEYLLEDGRRIPGSDVAPLTMARLGLGNYIPHHATFIRRELFERSRGFNESLRYCMDYELWLRLFALEDPVHIDTSLAVFRVHSGSVSSANRRAAIAEEFSVRMKYCNIAPTTLPRYLYRFIKRWWNNGYVS